MSDRDDNTPAVGSKIKSKQARPVIKRPEYTNLSEEDAWSDLTPTNYPRGRNNPVDTSQLTGDVRVLGYALTEIKEDLKEIKASQKECSDKISHIEKEFIEKKTKTNIMWAGIVGTVSLIMSIVVAAVKAAFFGG